MIQTHYVHLERPFRIIYAEGHVGLQIGTLIAVDDGVPFTAVLVDSPQKERSAFCKMNKVKKSITTYSYPVVSYINKNKEGVNISYSDVSYGGGWSEAEVWDFTVQQDVATLCLEGGLVKWNSMLEILVPGLRQCKTYEETVEALINVLGNLQMIKELGGNLEGPNLEMTSYLKDPNGKTRVIVSLTCERESDGTLFFHTSETDSMIEKPFQFFAHAKDVVEAARIIRRQEQFYNRFKLFGNQKMSFAMVFDNDRNQPEDGKSELLKLITLLKEVDESK